MGFSWTYLLFGFLVPLFRGEIAISAMHLLIALFTLWLPWNILMGFLYNRQYMTRMLTSGWGLADTPERNAMAAAKLSIESRPMVTAGE